MPGAIPFPDISPEVFAIGPFALRWYALAYIVGIALGWLLVRQALKTPRLWPAQSPPMTPAGLESFLTWVILGVILGGRLGYVLIYRPDYYLANPLEIPILWQGGMAFHGGAVGVLVAALLWCRANGVPFVSTCDALALGTPPGLLLGRIANFINAELWGRPTDAPWGVVFPGPRAQDCTGVEGECARHPSQLYEAGLEGLVLGLVLIALAWSGGLRVRGLMTGVFLAGYGLARFTVEFWRQADPQYVTPDNPWGHVMRLGEAGLTMGQILSLPMALAGVAVIALARRRA